MGHRLLCHTATHPIPNTASPHTVLDTPVLPLLLIPHHLLISCLLSTATLMPSLLAHQPVITPLKPVAPLALCCPWNPHCPTLSQYLYCSQPHCPLLSHIAPYISTFLSPIPLPCITPHSHSEPFDATSYICCSYIFPALTSPFYQPPDCCNTRAIHPLETGGLLHWNLVTLGALC